MRRCDAIGLPSSIAACGRLQGSAPPKAEPLVSSNAALKAKYRIQFNANVQNQRGALAILNGRVRLLWPAVSSDDAGALIMAATRRVPAC